MPLPVLNVGVAAADEATAETLPEAEIEEIDWGMELEERTDEAAAEPVGPELIADDINDAEESAELGATDGALDINEALSDGAELKAELDETTALEGGATALLRTDEGTESELTDAARHKEA